MSSLSPFAIKKVLDGMIGTPKNIKQLRSGNLLVEYEKIKHIEKLLRLNKFHDLKVTVSIHGSLNSCKGVFRCPDFKGARKQEILEDMGEQGVKNVRRIRIRRDGTLKDTDTFEFPLTHQSCLNN